MHLKPLRLLPRLHQLRGQLIQQQVQLQLLELERPLLAQQQLLGPLLPKLQLQELKSQQVRKVLQLPRQHFKH